MVSVIYLMSKGRIRMVWDDGFLLVHCRMKTLLVANRMIADSQLASSLLM